MNDDVPAKKAVIGLSSSEAADWIACSSALRWLSLISGCFLSCSLTHNPRYTVLAIRYTSAGPRYTIPTLCYTSPAPRYTFPTARYTSPPPRYTIPAPRYTSKSPSYHIAGTVSLKICSTAGHASAPW